MARYRKRPPEVEAIQFTGDNTIEIVEWASTARTYLHVTQRVGGVLYISDLSSDIRVLAGRWIVVERGDVRVMSNRDFTETYEPAGGQTDE